MMKKHLPFLALLSLAVACGIDAVPPGLGKAPSGDGPRVRFDMAHRPLPDVPLPNDFATFPDPTSRTGRRINVSAIAPSGMERIIREAFNDMEGWGTTQPLNVSFDKVAGVDPNAAAIDLEDFAARMQNDEHDLSNDPVYLINLTTGVPMFLDAGNGHYPLTLRDPHKYYPNDPKAGEANLLYESVEEGYGLTQADYRPELDKDFDGVLDHPNVLGNKGIFGVDNLLTWYERETDTLILRPVLPLEEKTEYAVILTDRLRGPNGKPVRSPFEAIYHPLQRRGMQRVGEILNEKRLAAYFGDLAGTGLDRVAFGWTFTTQPTQEDMRILRDGLYGKGPFARLGGQFPPDAVAFASAGKSLKPEDAPGWETSSEACKKRAKFPRILKLQDKDVKDSFHTLLGEVFGLDPGDLRSTEAALQWIDHIVIGSFQAPFLMGDPASRDPDTRFHVNFQTGEGDVRPDEVTYFMTVPKERPNAKQPFPVSLLGHGVTGHSDEALFYGGDYARQGIALMSINMPEHGVSLSKGDLFLAQAQLAGVCAVPFIDGYLKGRAHDLSGDGKPDSGWFWWTTHIPHTRDNVRQGLLDSFQAIRVLRAMDGQRKALPGQDYNGNGQPDDLAGDFDGNGVPDVGGPNVPYFASGESLGSIMSQAQGGAEPYIIASSSAGGGGGSLAMDVAFRSYGVVEAVTGQMLTPIIFSVPASERPDRRKKLKDSSGKETDQIDLSDRSKENQMGTRCKAGERTVRQLVNEGDAMHELELACLPKDELDDHMTVVVSNTGNKEVRCARTTLDGRFRVSIPASVGDRLDVQIYTAPDVVDSYKGCRVLRGSPVGRRIKTFEQAALYPIPVGEGTPECSAEQGCAQFRDSFYAVGSALVATNEGFGLQRQTPAVRRLQNLAQAAFDPADPVNFAPYYALRPMVDETGKVIPKRALLAVNTVGDAFVAISAGHTFARAAGAIPFLPPSAVSRYPDYADYVTPDALYKDLGGKTPMQVLIDNGVIEGVARMGRTSAGPTCKQNFRGVDPETCKNARTIDKITCANALYDPDWVSEGAMLLDQPHGPVPLRLARLSDATIRDSVDLAKAWEPRLRGVPFAPDATGWSASGPVLALFNHYLEAGGKHTWDVPDYCRAWDFTTYGNALIARFFATRGKDVYYLSHPTSHPCLEKGTCDFLAQPGP